MKIQFGALLVATLVLAGCENPSSKAADGQASASQPTATAQATPKKRCGSSTGSRLGSCDEGSPDVQGSSGDDFRRSSSTFNNTAPQHAPF